MSNKRDDVYSETPLWTKATSDHLIGGGNNSLEFHKGRPGEGDNSAEIHRPGKGCHGSYQGDSNSSSEGAGLVTSTHQLRKSNSVAQLGKNDVLTQIRGKTTLGAVSAPLSRAWVNEKPNCSRPAASPLKPLSLSHSSPQDTISLLTSPDDDNLQGESAPRLSPSKSALSDSGFSTKIPLKHDLLYTPNLVFEGRGGIEVSKSPTAAGTSPHIFTTNATKVYREQVAQLLTTLQSNLTESQERIEKQGRLLQEKDMQIDQLESERYHLQQSFQKVQDDLEEQCCVAIRHNRQADESAAQVESLERQLACLRERLEEGATKNETHVGSSTQQKHFQLALAAERAQIQELQSKWLEVQKTQIEDLEAQHAVKQEEIFRQYEDLDTERRQLKEERRRLASLDEVLRRREKEATRKQGQLEGFEDSLQERHNALEDRNKVILQHEVLARNSIRELREIEASLRKENDSLERKMRSNEAKNILTEQAFDDLRERRVKEEEKLKLLSQNLDEMHSQSRKVRADSKAVKEALKEKIFACHAEYNRVQDEVIRKREELASIKMQLGDFIEQDRRSRQSVNERAKQEVVDMELLSDKMEKTQNGMLVEEEAIVEQRKEREDLLQIVLNENIQLGLSHQERLRREEARLVSGQTQLNQAFIQQAAKAKEELMSLGRFMAAQNETMTLEYERRFLQLDKKEQSIEETAGKTRFDQFRLERQISEYISKRKQAEELVNRLQSSENKSTNHRSQLEWEVVRLNALLETERRIHVHQLGDELRQQEIVLEQLQSIHVQEVQRTSCCLLEREAELARMEGEVGSLQAKLVKLQDLRMIDLESLKRENKSLEISLTHARERADVAEHECLHLRQGFIEQKRAETEEKERMQEFIGRLEANGAELAKKQKSIASQDKLMKIASSDLEFKIKEIDKKERSLSRQQRDLRRQVEERREDLEQEASHQREALRRALAERNEFFKKEFCRRKERLKHEAGLTREYLRQELARGKLLIQEGALDRRLLMDNNKKMQYDGVGKAISELKMKLTKNARLAGEALANDALHRSFALQFDILGVGKDLQQKLTRQSQAAEKLVVEQILAVEKKIYGRIEISKTQKIEVLRREFSSQCVFLKSSLRGQREMLQQELADGRGIFEDQMSVRKYDFIRGLSRKSRDLAYKMSVFRSSLEHEGSSLGEEMERQDVFKQKNVEIELSRVRDFLRCESSRSKAALEEVHEGLALQMRNTQKVSLGRLMNTSWRQNLEAASAAFSKWVSVTMFELASGEGNGFRVSKRGLDTSMRVLEEKREELDFLVQQLEERAAVISKDEERLQVSKAHLEKEAWALAAQTKAIETKTKTIEEQSKASWQGMKKRNDAIEQHNMRAKQSVEERSRALEQQAIILAQQLKDFEKQKEDFRVRIREETVSLEKRERALEEREISFQKRFVHLQLTDKLKAKKMDENATFERRLNQDRELLSHERALLDQASDSLKKFEENLTSRQRDLEGRESQIVARENELDKFYHKQDAAGIKADRAISRALDHSLDAERKWMEETAACVFEREAELNRKEMALRRTEEVIRKRDAEIEAGAREVKAAQVRMLNLTQQVKEKEDIVKEEEEHLDSELQKCRQAQSRVQQMALQLKEKDDQLAKKHRLVEQRTAECDILEQQLQQWQQELEGGGGVKLSKYGGT